MRIDSAPDGARRVAQRTLEEDPALLRALAGETGERPAFDLTLPVYVISPTDVMSGVFLDAAVLVAWRFTVSSALRPIATIDVSHRQDTFVFDHLTRGHSVAAAVDAVRSAERVTPDGVVPRLLTVPAFSFAGLWLHAADNDRLVPLTSSAPGFTPQESYPAADVLRGLQQLGRRHTALSESRPFAFEPAGNSEPLIPFNRPRADS